MNNLITLSRLDKLIELSVSVPPSSELTLLCGKYYQPYYQLMWRLSSDIYHGLRVELGVEKGRGLGSMALGNSFRCIGLDNNVRYEAVELSKYYAHMEVNHLSSLPVPDFIPKQSISILHIDTEHSYSMAKAEFEAYQDYLLPGAVVLFDDLHAKENDVLRFFSELPYPKIQDDRLHPVCGYGVMVYE